MLALFNSIRKILGLENNRFFSTNKFAPEASLPFNLNEREIDQVVRAAYQPSMLGRRSNRDRKNTPTNNNMAMQHNYISTKIKSPTLEKAVLKQEIRIAIKNLPEHIKISYSVLLEAILTLPDCDDQLVRIKALHLIVLNATFKNDWAHASIR